MGLLALWKVSDFFVKEDLPNKTYLEYSCMVLIFIITFGHKDLLLCSEYAHYTSFLTNCLCVVIASRFLIYKELNVFLLPIKFIVKNIITLFFIFVNAIYAQKNNRHIGLLHLINIKEKIPLFPIKKEGPDVSKTIGARATSPLLI